MLFLTPVGSEEMAVREMEILSIDLLIILAPCNYYSCY